MQSLFFGNKRSMSFPAIRSCQRHILIYLPVAFLAGACSSNDFQCVTDGKCIPVSRKCDRRPDCSDGSDEYNCPRPRCSSNQLTCDDGSCIELYQQCNGVRDCPSGSDEEGCRKLSFYLNYLQHIGTFI